MLKLYGIPPYKTVLLHGGPGARGSLSAFAGNLSEYTGVAEQLQTGFDMTELVEELKGDLEGLPRVVLLGHSFGAWLGIYFAAAYPALVDKLILVGSGPLSDAYVGQIAVRRRRNLSFCDRRRLRQTEAALAAGDAAALDNLKALTAVSDNYRPIAPDDTEADGKAYAALWPQAAKMRSNGELAEAAGKLACPVYIIHGRRDPHPYRGVIEPLKKAGVEPKIFLLPRCGHSPFNERFAAAPFIRIVTAICRGEY